MGMRPLCPVELGAQSQGVGAEPSVNRAQESHVDVGGGERIERQERVGERVDEVIERHEQRVTSSHALPTNGGVPSEMGDRLQQELPPFYPRPSPLFSASRQVYARPQERAPCAEVGRKSLKRALPHEDPSVVLLDELSADSVTNAVLGFQRPGEGDSRRASGVQPTGDKPHRVALVVWNVGHCGDDPGPLSRVVDGLARLAVVDDWTRVLVLDDAKSRLEGPRCDVRGVPGSHEEVVANAVEIATHALKVRRLGRARHARDTCCDRGAPFFILHGS